MKHRHTQERGFTLLIAALIASVVLALGSSIFTIAQKQVQLSSIGRDSQYAFYAADTAAECALYWDVRHSAFGTSTATADGTTPACDGSNLTITGGPADPNAVDPYPYEKSFTVNLFADTGSGYCAVVSVKKSDANPHTVIQANGYSTSCTTLDSAPRALQRSVVLTY